MGVGHFRRTFLHWFFNFKSLFPGCFFIFFFLDIINSKIDFAVSASICALSLRGNCAERVGVLSPFSFLWLCQSFLSGTSFAVLALSETWYSMHQPLAKGLEGKDPWCFGGIWKREGNGPVSSHGSEPDLCCKASQPVFILGSFPSLDYFLSRQTIRRDVLFFCRHLPLIRPLVFLLINQLVLNLINM